MTLWFTGLAKTNGYELTTVGRKARIYSFHNEEKPLSVINNRKIPDSSYSQMVI